MGDRVRGATDNWFQQTARRAAAEPEGSASLPTDRRDGQVSMAYSAASPAPMDKACRSSGAAGSGDCARASIRRSARLVRSPRRALPGPGKKRPSFRSSFLASQLAAAKRRCKVRLNKSEGRKDAATTEGTIRDVNIPSRAANWRCEVTSAELLDDWLGRHDQGAPNSPLLARDKVGRRAEDGC